MKMVLELPHIAAICKDGSRWVLPVEARDEFIALWMGGKTFWSGLSAWGDPVWVKLADITGVVEKTEAGIALQEEEDAERKAREVTA